MNEEIIAQIKALLDTYGYSLAVLETVRAILRSSVPDLAPTSAADLDLQQPLGLLQEQPKVQGASTDTQNPIL